MAYSPNLDQGYIELPLLAANPSHKEGRVFYDTTQKALSFFLDIAGVTPNLPFENYIRVINKSGATITNGTPVYVDGNDAATGLPTIQKAQADTRQKAGVIGIMTHDITNNSQGVCTAFGEINGLNTNAYNNGDYLYLDAVTAGAFTTTVPDRPNMQVFLGIVTKKDLTNGIILVLPNRVGPGDFLSANPTVAMKTVSGGSPERSLNSNFTPSSTRPTLGIYTVHLNTGSVTSGNTGEATADLRIAASGTPGSGDTQSGGDDKLTAGGILGNVAHESNVILIGYFKPGYVGRIATSVVGGGSATLLYALEITL